MNVRIDDAAVLRGGAAAADAPLVLLLHGFGSSERDLPGIMQHLPHGLAWASLRAPLPLGHGGAAFHPVAVVQVVDALDESIIWGVDMAADHALAVSSPCFAHDCFFKAGDELHGFFDAVLEIG